MGHANFVNGAAGTIGTSLFVIMSASVSKAVDQATGAGTVIAGISQEFSKLAPIPGASLVAASVQGDPIFVYQNNDVCLLSATTSGWTEGQLLTADSTGRGIAASSTDHYGAQALTTMTGVGLGQVKILIGKNI
jgi:hypothetical protein